MDKFIGTFLALVIVSVFTALFAYSRKVYANQSQASTASSTRDEATPAHGEPPSQENQITGGKQAKQLTATEKIDRDVRWTWIPAVFSAPQRWEQIRKRGRNHFIWTRGVLGFGLPGFIGWLITHHYFLGGNYYDFLGGLLVIIPAMAFFGYRFGRRQWDANEKQFSVLHTRRLLALYIAPDVVAQREQFLEALAPQPAERILDVGSGPGFLTIAIGEKVGASGRVCGIDISEALLAVARSNCAHQAWVEIRQGDATQVPFPNDSFDAAVSTQVLEYARDVDAAVAELYRVVRPGGRLVVVDTDWDSIVWHSSNKKRMNRILAAWEQHAAHPYLPRTLANMLRRAGFRVEHQQVIPLLNATYDRNTYSNRLFDLIVPFVINRCGITRAEAKTWSQELRQFGERGDYFFSLNRYLFLATKS